ncbi:GNAT family N-acetyltransferase [Streptomyces sp. 142MFCol3.1]|uniref:GNAT family N-acetyltransferase n=1 Tax=Streptomyces sp. 142MFCol3.1 TaxID=1172179 RepID=UPI0004031DA1|nr:GNAT family N-acetyltransferase [Streptomyces sp. 142MFCol3.1]
MTDDVIPAAPIVERLARYERADQDEILGDGADPFGVADAGLTWLPKEEHFGIRLAGRLVAHTGLLRIPLSIGGTRRDVMGVGGVAVAPDLRGRGLARLVVTAAVDHARTLCSSSQPLLENAVVRVDESATVVDAMKQGAARMVGRHPGWDQWSVDVEEEQCTLSGTGHRRTIPLPESRHGGPGTGRRDLRTASVAVEAGQAR